MALRFKLVCCDEPKCKRFFTGVQYKSEPEVIQAAIKNGWQVPGAPDDRCPDHKKEPV